jgi:hypothetical protein
MHNTINLANITYMLAGNKFVMTLQGEDTISNRAFNTISNAASAVYKAESSDGEYQAILSYSFTSFSHTFDFAPGLTTVDPSTPNEQLKDTLVLTLAISDATGDG